MRVLPKDKSWRSQDYYGCLGRYDGRADCDQKTVPREPIDEAVRGYFERVGLDVDAMVAEHAEARKRRLRDVRARIRNAQATATRAEAELAKLDAMLRNPGKDGLQPAEWRTQRATPEAELGSATGALDDLRAEEQAILDEADLADAEQETLVELAELRARFAEGIATAGDVEATQSALRRLFSHFVLHDLRDARNGGRPVALPKGRLHLPPGHQLIGDHCDDWIIEPVPHERMIVTDPPLEFQGWESKRERLTRVPLQTTRGGSKASAR
jgi:hypothetical protein